MASQGCLIVMVALEWAMVLVWAAVHRMMCIVGVGRARLGGQWPPLCTCCPLGKIPRGG